MDYLYFGSMVFTSVMSLSLAIFFKSEVEPKLNLYWRLFMVAFVVWSFGRALMMLSGTPDWALFWIRIAYCGSIWLSVLWTWMGYEILRKKIPKKIFVATILLFSVFTVLNFTPAFISSVSPKLNFAFYDDNPGWAFNVWSIVFTIFAVWIHVLLIMELKKADSLTRNRILWILLAGILGFGGSATTFPLVNDVPLYPFAVPLVAISPAILTYAVVRFQLMDLYLLLRDTTVHLVSSLAFACVFSGVAWVINRPKVYVFSMMVMAVFIPFAYPYVSRFVRRNINRTRLGDVDRYLDDIEEKSSQILGSSLTIISLSTATLDLINAIFPVDRIGVYFMKSKKEALHLYANKGMNDAPVDLQRGSPIFQWFANNKKILSKDSLQENGKPEKYSLIEFMNQIHGEVICPIYVSKELSGLIVLGQKRSGAHFHNKDLEAIMLVARKVEIACGYAATTEKYTVVMDNWTHSLNQITKPIAHGAGYIKEMVHMLTPEEIVSTADVIEKRTMQLREVHDYITNASSLNREIVTGEYRMEKVDVREVAKSYLKNYEVENKQVVVVEIMEGPVFARINKTGIERVLLELVSNSLRHTAQNGKDAKIRVRDNVKLDNYEINVDDNGDGIDPQNIDRIWEPGWQQKDMNAGASGLGLAICKQIVEAHGGKISAFSAGKGQGMLINFSLPIVKGTEDEEK
ncbi:MAG: Adaptive-response sensory-kinase SasA [Elusimicrobia bacterium]|nr:Adaptive-response sensory-kinase SasA [Elusimicrobiota bacterium]